MRCIYLGESSEVSSDKKTTENMSVSKKSKRLRWIDQARGFIMFYLVLTITWPPEDYRKRETNIVLHYLFGHAGTTDTYMTLFDAGAAAFILVLGLSMAISFTRRSGKHGSGKAVQHLVVRYLIILALGMLIIYADGGEFFNEDKGTVRWDVIPSIAAAGLVSIPFLFIRDPKKRLYVGIGWALLYQILMIFAGLKEYAINSVHGGIYGSIFGYAACGIIGTALGDYMYSYKDIEKDKKFKDMLSLGAIMAVGGYLLTFIPEMEAAKRQVSFTHVLISSGITFLGLSVFWYLDEKKDMELTYLRAFGMNPFLMYLLVLIPDFLIVDLVELYDADTDWLMNSVFMVIYILIDSVVALFLYKKRKSLSTEKVAIGAIIIVVGLAAILIFGLGIEL